MKIKRLETFMANAGLRNYLFVRLTTDTGVTGIGEGAIRSTSRASPATWCATSTRAARR
jgi:galactonate dehydratase